MIPDKHEIRTDGGSNVDMTNTDEPERNTDRSKDRVDSDEFEPKRDVVNFVTQDTRYNLVVDMLGHPQQSPSLEELNYMNPSRSKSTIVNHLNELVKYGITKKLEIPGGLRERNLPRTFYRVSEPGYTLLRCYNLVPLDDRILQDRYSEIEKSEKIERYESAPRHEAVELTDNIEENKVHELNNAVEQCTKQSSDMSQAGEDLRKNTNQDRDSAIESFGYKLINKLTKKSSEKRIHNDHKTRSSEGGSRRQVGQK
jgi:hypothetical protein